MDSKVSRRRALAGGAAIAAAVLDAGMPATAGPATTPAATQPARPGVMPVKAFCIDFNWGDNGAARPGLYAHADPAEHVRWYQALGVNTIQTFCVSYNGYAWYPSEVAPVTPGLKSRDFLGEMVRRGHAAGISVMGYFTLGANPYWEARNPALVHHDPADYIRIPLTLEYLDYFCRSVEDALRKTDVDGFMMDWVRPTQHKSWLDCEKDMYRQLLGESFPASGSPSTEMLREFDRRSIARAWQHIQWVVNATRRVIIWTNHPILKAEYPIWADHPLLKEVDWILNEGPELEHLDWLRSHVGRNTLIVQNLCGWPGHDANAWKKIDTHRFGLYGFAKADPNTTLPDEKSEPNARNITILRQAYHNL